MIDFDIRNYIKSILPDGNYTFKIVDADLKPKKNNPECRYIAVVLEVISEFRKGTRIFDNFNIYYITETVQNIGRSRFAELCNAVNITELSMISEIIGKIVEAAVTEDEYIDKNTNKPVKKNKILQYFEYVGDKKASIKVDEVPFDDDIAF